MPTLLHLMGYDIPPRVDGRILHEALSRASTTSDLTVETRTYSAGQHTAVGLYQQHLTTTQVGSTTYLERGWVE
jgi:hypothetical protein